MNKHPPLDDVTSTVFASPHGMVIVAERSAVHSRPGLWLDCAIARIASSSSGSTELYVRDDKRIAVAIVRYTERPHPPNTEALRWLEQFARTRYNLGE